MANRNTLKSGAAAILAAVSLLSGCVPYPVYKTLQPSAHMTVLDAANKPLPGVEVTLIAGAYPYGREKSRSVKTTGMDGTADFAPVREWRAEVLVIHGSEEFYWNWCVRKDGFTTYLTEDRAADKFQNTAIVRLVAGTSSACL